MRYIDLHTHTTFSDGTMTPRECAAYAAEKGLAAFAVTDHDTAEGAAEAVKCAGEYGVEAVPGIEISVDYLGHGVHILGYFIDPASPALTPVLDWIVADRKRRNHEIIALMRADGIPVTAEGLRDKYPGAVVGRPHFAACLVENGLASSVKDAFDRYLNRGKKYFRPRTFLPVERAFEVIRDAGGKACIAHPLQYRLDEPALVDMVERMVSSGAVGMECLYSGYTPEQSRYLMGLAARYGLCVTGGSDFHGSRKPQIDMGTGTGDLRVPYELLEELRAR